ncbi:MAG: YkgJ family cysteine cluster protein [Candidatus Helarchaeota archaeon]
MRKAGNIFLPRKISKKKSSSNFICQLCGKCCSQFCVPVTHYDLKRILSLLKLPKEGKSIAEIAEFIEPDESVAETYEDIPRPILEDYEAPDLLLVLKSDEYCVFYSNQEQGCKIYPARPLVCRFFPFTYEYVEDVDSSSPPPDLETHEVKFSVNEECDYCLGIKKGTNYDFRTLTSVTHQTTREDADFEKIITLWNLDVIFGHRSPYDEEAFFDFLVECFPDDE